MASSRIATLLAEQRLERVIGHVSDFWLPVNQELLKEIRQEVTHATDDLATPAIISKLKGDVSLFFHSLKKLAELIQNSGREITSDNPIQLLEEGGIAGLREIFSDSGEITRFTFEEGTEAQLSRFHEMLVSASTSVALAESYGFDEEAAYTAAIMRQLGLTLIAWSYPGIYQEAILSLGKNPNSSLEQEVAKQLGFTPQLLAIHLFRRWGFDESYCSRYGLRELQPTEEADDFSGEEFANIAELCKVGEALARAHHPEIYPKSRYDLVEALHVISSRLGDSGMQFVREQIDHSTAIYQTFMPDICKCGLADLYALPEVVGHDAELSELRRNPFLNCCSPEMGRAVRRLYTHIDGGLEASVCTRVFVDEVVPVARFQGGCVYTADPSIMMLIPQLPFGELTLREPVGVDYSVVLSSGDLISLAFQDLEPVVEYKKSQNGQLCTAIAGMFGGDQRVGVLYLEIPELVSDFVRDEQVLHFQVLRYALVDCLRLKRS